MLTFTNQAALSYRNRVRYSNLTTGQIADALVLSKEALTPETVGADRQVTYTFTIENEGNAATSPEDQVTVTDTFDPALIDLTVTLDGASLAQPGGYTYDEGTGAFATVPGILTVPAATYTQDPATGVYTAEPGEAVLVVTGTIQTN